MNVLTDPSETPAATTATLVVSRTLPGDIPAGAHRVRFDNTLQRKTFEFTAGPGERVEFRLANTTGRFGLPFLALMGVAPLFLKIERV